MVRTAQSNIIYMSPYVIQRFNYTLLFIQNDFKMFTRRLASFILDAHLASESFDGIRYTLWCLTEAVHLSNIHGSKVQIVGWLVQIQSLCARSHSPNMPCIRLQASTCTHMNHNGIIHTKLQMWVYSVTDKQS